MTLMDTITTPLDELRAAYDEAVELADGDAVDACAVLLEAVEKYLHAAS